MPRYYFDVTDHNGTHIDEVGMDFPDTDTAVAEGRRALAEITREIAADTDRARISIDIRDGSGTPIRIKLSLTTEGPDD